ncbi:MAG: 3-deoxy-D-manno-octulosonic acid transferase [Rhodospirillales bacterium]|nr:MAG: 3-deoxy-D-manno-octulosonic acid transferase [Rhodospirillales bacterium]
MNVLGPYRALTGVAAPLVRLYLRRRVARGKEDPARLAERRGIASRARPDGPLVWVHAASVGEAQSVLALVGRILDMRGDASLLVTTGTVTSANLMQARLPARALHQYVPVDVAGWVQRFLAHWRPQLALLVESELWPNLIRATAARGCPIVIVNGRMSDRSFARWQRAPATARALLGCFALCLGQTPADRDRFAALGAANADYVGNLKYSAAPLPADEAELAALRAQIGDRPLWLAASTHPGEESLATAAHRHLASRAAGVLTIIVPRHPNRGDEIAATLEASGLRVCRRSAGGRPEPDCDVYLADTLGELGLFYRLADIVFIGGSTGALGGHNPLEAAQLSCAILHGPDMSNFRTVAADLKAARAAEVVTDAAALAAAVALLLDDPGRRRRMAESARAVTAANAAALDNVAGALTPVLDALPAAARG